MKGKDQQNLIHEDDYDEDYDQFSVRLTAGSSFANAANRLLFSRAFTIFYIVMLLLNVVLIVWILVNASILKRLSSPENSLFISLEIVVNLALFFEVGVRMLSLGKKYFYSKSNVFDLVVLTLSIGSITIYFAANGHAEEADITSTLLLIFRYAIQFLRLLLFVKNQQKTRTVKSVHIDFEDPSFPQDTE